MNLLKNHPPIVAEFAKNSDTQNLPYLNQKILHLLLQSTTP